MEVDTNSKDFEEFLDSVCRFNYDNPEGSFYSMRIAFNNSSYNKLPLHIISMMKTSLKKAFHDGDLIDTRLTSSENELFWKKAQETVPTDEIILPTFEDGKKLSCFWMPPGYTSKGSPADLVFNKTVPLTDVVLNFRQFGKMDNEYVPISFRVFLYEDYKRIVDKVKSMDDCLAIIGGIIPNFKYEPKKKKKQKEPQIAYTICIGSNTDFLMVINTAYRNCSRDEIIDFRMHEIHTWNTIILNTFYGCQLALLNPIIEKVFIKAKEHPVEERKIYTNNTHNKQRKTMYIKRYYIRESDINDTIEAYKSHNVRCPLWWVIGHRRTYKSGKTIWVTGYWKGKERHKVKNLNESDSLQLRQRLIDMRSAE